MKTIGFIDYYLDEWHAQEYPAWIEEATNGEMKVLFAYGLSDKANGLTNEEWCREKGIQLARSVEEVVEKSDCLVVLSPDNPEYHEQLAELPLRSGKPTYIDKTFAPDRATALRMFETAEKFGTPMYSTSALRFAQEYAEAKQQQIETICSIGPGAYENYSIHQIEPIVALMGEAPDKVMFIGTPSHLALLIAFEGGRQASLHHYGNSPFSLTIGYGNGQAQSLKPESDFFKPFIGNLTQFFETGVSPVDSAQTIAAITLYEYGKIAARTPLQWVGLPKSY